jgi:predicted negative regulator of RcsB-dependent stress response
MINVYLNEHEQWIAIKKWWEKYNAIVIIIFSLILLSCSAYKYWQWHRQSQLQQASNTYERMMLASANHQTDEIRSIANSLVKDYPNSIYADAARLSLAKIAVSAKEYPEAESQLTWVAEHSNTPEMSDVAKIRLARLWVAHQKFPDALKILKGLKSPAYLPLVDELRGDIYTGLNKFDKAVDFYRKALSEVQNYGVGNLFLEMKSSEMVAQSQQHLPNQFTEQLKKPKNV